MGALRKLLYAQLWLCRHAGGFLLWGVIHAAAAGCLCGVDQLNSGLHGISALPQHLLDTEPRGDSCCGNGNDWAWGSST